MAINNIEITESIVVQGKATDKIIFELLSGSVAKTENIAHLNKIYAKKYYI